MKTWNDAIRAAAAEAQKGGCGCSNDPRYCPHYPGRNIPARILALMEPEPDSEAVAKLKELEKFAEAHGFRLRLRHRSSVPARGSRHHSEEGAMKRDRIEEAGADYCAGCS